VALVLTFLLEPWKAALAGKYWVAQERWRLKAQIYEKLLQNLDDQARILDVWDLEEWRQREEEEEAPSAATSGRSLDELELRDEPLRSEPDPNTEGLQKLSVEVMRLRSLADLWLTAQARDGLDKMDKEVSDIYRNQQCHPNGLACRAVSDARELVAAAAREDLRLEVGGGRQSRARKLKADSSAHNKRLHPTAAGAGKERPRVSAGR
jgi:hypothetical protein